MCLASNTHATLTTYHWQESLCNYITATEGGWSYGQLLITRGCRDDRRPTVCHDLSKTITFLSFAILFFSGLAQAGYKKGSHDVAPSLHCGVTEKEHFFSLLYILRLTLHSAL